MLTGFLINDIFVKCAIIQLERNFQGEEMNRNTQVGVEILEIVKSALERMTPAHYRAPKGRAPRFSTLLGVATEYQKSLYSLAEISEEEHDVVHALTGLPFGGNIGLPVSHRALHAIIGFSQSFLDEDITNTYGYLEGRTYLIDREWNVYAVEHRLFKKLAMLVSGRK